MFSPRRNDDFLKKNSISRPHFPVRRVVFVVPAAVGALVLLMLLMLLMLLALLVPLATWVNFRTSVVCCVAGLVISKLPIDICPATRKFLI